jgi:hypothetical protein
MAKSQVKTPQREGFRFALVVLVRERTGSGGRAGRRRFISTTLSFAA